MTASIKALTLTQPWASLVAIGAFPMIKTLEGICGLLLLSNRFVPLALVRIRSIIQQPCDGGP